MNWKNKKLWIVALIVVAVFVIIIWLTMSSDIECFRDSHCYCYCCVPPNMTVEGPNCYTCSKLKGECQAGQTLEIAGCFWGVCGRKYNITVKCIDNKCTLVEE